MGVDLTLLPFDGDFGDRAFSHTALPCTRRSNLFNAISEVSTMEVPDDFSTYFCRDDEYEEAHYGNTQETPYGQPLRWCYVKDLTELSDHDGVTDNPRNEAIWAFLEQLSDKTKVSLYWH